MYIKTLLLAFLIFFIAVTVHAIVHRLLLRIKIVTLRSIIVYLLGLFVLSYIVFSYQLPIPFTGIVIYLLLSSIIMFFYFAICLGGDTPSAKIIASFHHKTTQTFEDILGLFTDDILIWKRIADLEVTHFIYKHNNTYTVTKRGAVLVLIAHWYRSIFNRTLPE